jgi:AAT family amino acid transporter
MTQSNEEGLQRSLSLRHVQLIAISGAIGVGLFLASGDAIGTAGPSILFSYLLGGLFTYFIIRALGEISIEYPISGSFSAYAHKFISPCAGFVVGWTFWLLWTLSCMVQVTAIGIYCSFWWPELPRWIPALISLVCISASNLLNVKNFGEIAFWSSIIKIITIILIIISGIIIIFLGLGNNAHTVGISNLFQYGGFFAHGFKGVFIALTMVTFAFIGLELVGTAAGEIKNPEKNIPSVINRVLIITLSLYLGTLFVILCMYPWPEIAKGGGVEKSPFVLTFAGLGIKQAAAIINFVVITASLSTANSGMFSNGRMLYNLALQKQAPKFLAKVNPSTKIPSNGVIVSFIFCLLGVVLNAVVPESVFMMLVSITTFLGLFIWGAIIVVHMYSRRGKSADDIAKLKYPMLFYPYSSYIVLIGVVFIATMLAVKSETRATFIVGPIWLILIYSIYKLFVKEKKA